MFDRAPTLTPTLSAEKKRVALCTMAPTVTASRRLQPWLCPILQRVEVSDCHSLVSVPLLPRQPTEWLKTPNPIPTKVKLVDPVLAEFAEIHALRLSVAEDTAWLTVPCLSPEVKTKRRLPNTLALNWQRTALSAAHSVFSQAE
jgi:hypothetical protein